MTVRGAVVVMGGGGESVFGASGGGCFLILTDRGECCRVRQKRGGSWRVGVVVLVVRQRVRYPRLYWW